MFLSYSHDSETHRERVLAQAQKLRQHGVDAWIDRFVTSPPEGWPRWMQAEFERADFVLAVCTETYCRRFEGREEPGQGLGANWEGFVATQRLYEAGARNGKVIPVLWMGTPADHVPVILRGVTRYQLDEGFERLLRHLFERPEIVPVPIGPRPALPQYTVAAAGPEPVCVPLPVQPVVSQGAHDPGVWQVPLPRNPHFRGRDELLDELAKALYESGEAALTPAVSGRAMGGRALTGLGGIGKTQTALAYAYRHQREYAAVWWLDAESEPVLLASYGRIARALGLVGEMESDPQVAVHRAHAWLADHARWLVVFDNAEAPALVRKYLPSVAGGHVLVTSRNPAWRSVAPPLVVPLLSREEAVNLLMARCGQSDIETARALAAELGDLPLALAQAAAYIESTGCDLGHYQGLFRRAQARLLGKGDPPEGYSRTVAATWSLAFDKVRRESPAAAELLSLLAFLDPSGVPLRLVREQAEHLPAVLAQIAADPLELDAAIGLLRRHALVEREGERLLVHRLVQMVVREHLGQEAARHMATRAVAAVKAAFPFDWHGLATWASSREMLPHALTATAHATKLGAGTVVAGHLLHRAGQYLHRHGLLAEARQALERALEVWKKVLGTEEHPDVAASLYELAKVLQALGELTEARRHLELFLEIKKEVLGTEEHPDVAISLTVLAIVLQAQGELAEARRHLERSLEIWREVLGSEEHLEMAASLHTLATVLHAQGELAEARRHLERSLEIAKKVLGTEEHPDVAASLHELARVLHAQGELAEAQQHCERSLAIKASVYGTREHYYTAMTEVLLGRVLLQTGEREAGLELLCHALAVYQKQLGAEHSYTRNLTAFLQSQGIAP